MKVGCKIYYTLNPCLCKFKILMLEGFIDQFIKISRDICVSLFSDSVHKVCENIPPYVKNYLLGPHAKTLSLLHIQKYVTYVCCLILEAFTW